MEQHKTLAVEINYDHSVNFAMQQNDVPVVRLLRLENRGTEPLDKIAVRVWIESEISDPWETEIDSLGPGQTYNLENIDLALRAEVLARQLERQKTSLLVEVLVGGERQLAQRLPIEILAYHEWGGLSSLPEILAAFVLPNHPALGPMLAAAGQLLGEATGSANLDGYQSKDPARARAIVRAIHGAAGAAGISYINPPASFEEQGQKVRLPDQLLKNKLGTCLDLALLLAGLFEQAGLHPLVVIIEGHAFVGAWLIEDHFPEPAVDDGIRLRKRVRLGEIVVLEATSITTRPSQAFENAASDALAQLENAENFHCAIDIRCARKMRIRPLPLRIEAGSVEVLRLARAGSAATATTVVAPSSVRSVATAQEAAEAGEQPVAEPPHERLRRWKRKLLDLSLRNRLINYKPTRRSLPLLCPDLAALEDALADGKTFQLRPKPTLMDGQGPRDAETHRQRTGEDALEAYLLEQLAGGCLHTDLTETELERSTLALFREARTALEESGANLLYLALGFLEWFEAPSSEIARRAPIVLLPVSLIRPSVREGFRIVLADEDARVNTTLLEKLKTEFPVDVDGLDQLPEDESGLNIALILHRFRAAVKEMPRWDVVEQAQIGLFSFTKFLMWLDLEERKDALMNNEVVRQLVERPARELGGGATFPALETLDAERDPAETYCPLDSDSSQLAAIYAAHDGRSFVLEGPPGTGKSQTITNLVAHCLGHGKRVLFVSEKMAALNVVHQRLCKVGLGAFCLELHSNKANKKHVLAQLQDALAHHDPGVADEWSAAATELVEVRGDLNALVELQHRRRALGKSVFQVRSCLTALRDLERRPIRFEDVAATTREEFAQLRDFVDRLRVAAERVRDVKKHPLRAVQREEWSASLPDQVERALDQLGAAMVPVRESMEAAGKLLGMEGQELDAPSLNQLEWLTATVRLLLEARGPGRALLTEPGFDDLLARLEDLLEQGRQRDARRTKLLLSYDERLLALDLEGLRSELERALPSFALLRWFRCRPVRKALKAVVKGRGLPASRQLFLDLEDACQVVDATRDLLDVARGGERFFAGHWRGGEADWEALVTMLEWAGSLRARLLEDAAGEGEAAVAVRDTVVGLATDQRDLLSAGASTGRVLRKWLEDWDNARDRFDALGALVELDQVKAFGPAAEPGWLDRMADLTGTWRKSRPLWNDWCFYRRARREAVEAGLLVLVEALESGELRPDALLRSFERAFYEAWLNATTDQEDQLRGFNSAEHERQIERFRALDLSMLELGCRHLRHTLAERAPALDRDAHEASELGILKREFGKQRRHMAVRKLIQKLPHLLPRLKPCFLMSPLSVAHYLDPNFPSFDLVVFDEASQIPVWDAVGAMARGTQVIVVGDSKQLPPTNFFMKVDDVEDAPDDDAFEEMESVLDDCVASLVPSLRLLWHYRSRHESLITFSNYHYYDNRLLTFPGPVAHSRRLGVSLRHFEQGVYDKGKSRTNRIEAVAVVREIVERLNAIPEEHDALESPESIGVVTFSQAQQNLVEDLLDAERRKNPKIDRFFGDAVPEPVFVKNLENVQGDERDVILFSVCYGPDAQGRVSMSFGPLNREGGERRLNVAITRARNQVIVFTSILADQIDLSRTRSVGVKHLKSYLDYARRGPDAIAEAITIDPDADFDSPFEQQVFEALTARGHAVDIQVGCSGYRIDLAVKHPERAGSFLLGVECDGAFYHSAKTARDRDRLRGSVLRALGWQLIRIWSTDWWLDPDRQIERIEQAIRQAMKGADKAPDATLQVEPESDGAQEPPAQARPARPGRALPYKSFKVGRPLGTTENFHESRSASKILEALTRVVVAEGPIRFDLACRRVGDLWQLGRVTQKVQNRIRALLDAARDSQRPVWRGEFLWPADLDPSSYSTFRVPASGEESARNAEEIPPVEIANAAEQILQQQFSLPTEALAKEVAALFGFARMGAKVQEAMEAGIMALADRGGCVCDEGFVKLPR